MADFERAKTKAKEVLQENFVEEPPVNVTDIAKNYGYEITEADLPSDVAGLVDPAEKAIYINMKDSPQRKAFTVAHELGHIKLHLSDLKANPDLGILFRRPLGKKDDDPQEQEANCFAANLLVPEEILSEKINYFKDLATPENLALLFGVSKDVINYRLRHINNNQLKT